MKVFVLSLIFIVSGGSDPVIETVSVKEGDSLTLQTDVTTNQQGRIKWYFNDNRIAQMYGDLSTACTDVQCNEGTERFRDRLKLDHQTGSLTITNITNTDSGLYELQINSSIKSFIVTVTGVPELDKMKRKSVKEGESVTLDPEEIKYPNYVMTWYFNEILIAEITGDQSQICTDDQCKEIFRDRLKLNQTGSLTITNTRNTDSGLYELKIISSSIGRRRRSISITNVKSFSVTVIGSGPSSGAVAAIAVVVLLVFAALTAAVVYRLARQNEDVI